MKKLNLLELMQNNSNAELPSGSRIVDMPEVIDVKKDCVELAMVLRGCITVIATTAGKKNIELIATGQACFFDEDDECIIPQEGSIFLLVNKRIHQKENASTGFLKRFGKKKIKSDDPDKEASTAESDNMEKEKEKSVLLKLMPKIKQTWYQVAGPITAGIVNDEANFKGMATTVYTVLPMPIRLVVKEEFFVNWCYEKRHILLVDSIVAGNELEDALSIAPKDEEWVNINQS